MLNLARQRKPAKNEAVITAQLPWAMRGFSRPHRYKVAKGGRGGSKSWTVARQLVSMAATLKLRILCCRELPKSIQDSVHRLLSDQIELMGLGHLYLIQKPTIICLTTGSVFIFEGLAHNVDKIKSLEGIDIAWVEEGQRVSEESWKVLTPLIRKDGSEILVTFNPDLETDPAWQRFVVNTPPDCHLVTINWPDNPWLPETLRKEKDYLWEVDRDAAAHIWGGEIRTSGDAQILHGKCKVMAFTPGPDWDGPYLGADWGFSIDPTTLHQYWIHDERLWVERESYHIKLELNDIAATWRRDIPGCENYMIRADNARPETINHVKKAGMKIIAASKWSGSVEDGIAFLRSFRDIVIHPRCVHWEQESRLYSYKTDKLTGDILTTILDKHNHCIDDGRYALDPMIKVLNRRKAQFL